MFAVELVKKQTISALYSICALVDHITINF